MTGVGAGVPRIGELVAGGLVTKVKNQIARPPAAEATDGVSSQVE
jgi:hypothetical protein